MITAWKYLLRSGPQEISMPDESELLHVGAQDGDLFLWARVDTDEPSGGARLFYVTGTGHWAPPDGDHVGSVVMADGLVWHVWEFNKPGGRGS